MVPGNTGNSTLYDLALEMFPKWFTLVRTWLGPTTICGFDGVMDLAEASAAFADDGSDGKLAMSYLHGDLTLNAYLMRCDIQGRYDYNAENLARACHALTAYLERAECEVRDVRQCIWYSVGDIELYERFRRLVWRIRREVADMVRRSVDSL